MSLVSCECDCKNAVSSGVFLSSDDSSFKFCKIWRIEYSIFFISRTLGSLLPKVPVVGPQK